MKLRYNLVAYFWDRQLYAQNTEIICNLKYICCICSETLAYCFVIAFVNICMMYSLHTVYDVQYMTETRYTYVFYSFSF